MTAITKGLLVCVLGLVAVSGARSVEPSSGVPPEKAKAPEVLTDAGFEEMIKGMGYDYAVSESADKSARWYRVNVVRSEPGGENLQYHVILQLGTNGMKIWGHMPLADLKPEHLANTEALVKLLEKNDSIGPNAFRVNPKTKRLFLSRCTEARGLTPARLREHLDGLVDGCVNTRDDWDSAKWTVEPAKK